jgi:hypothetical protein
VQERIKTMVKEMLEALMREEREIYLEQHSTKANGYYIHDLLTLVGPWRTSRFSTYGTGR